MTMCQAWQSAIKTPEPTSFVVTYRLFDFNTGYYGAQQTVTVSLGQVIPTASNQGILVKKVVTGYDSSGFFPVYSYLPYYHSIYGDEIMNNPGVAGSPYVSVSPSSWIDYGSQPAGCSTTTTTTTTTTPTPLTSTSPSSSYTYTLPDGFIVTSTTELSLDQLKTLYASHFGSTSSGLETTTNSTTTFDTSSRMYTDAQIDALFAGVAYTDIGQQRAITALQSDVAALKNTQNNVTLPSFTDVYSKFDSFQSQLDDYATFKQNTTTRFAGVMDRFNTIDSRLNDPVKGLDAINAGLAQAYQTDQTLSARIEGAYKDIADLADATNKGIDVLDQNQQNAQNSPINILSSILGGLATGGSMGLILILVVIFLLVRK